MRVQGSGDISRLGVMVAAVSAARRRLWRRWGKEWGISWRERVDAWNSSLAARLPRAPKRINYPG